MGCYMETAQATVDYLRDKGVKAGCLNVYCFRPFPAEHIVDALKDCMAFTVLERMDDPLSTTGNHLTREIKAAFCDAIIGQNGLEKIDRIPRIYTGCGGLGSRDVRPGDIIAIFDNMIHDGQDYFCVGIDHPLALKRDRRPRPAAHAAASRCAATRSAASARSPPTRSSPPSPARSSARTCRRIPSTARRRRACRRPTT